MRSRSTCRTYRGDDPNVMVRPASITATVGTATPWASGRYSYDGVGNVKAIGTNYYKYDHVSRLTEGTAEYASSTSHKRQTYAYDTYGNLKTITTIVDGATSNTQTLAPSPSTNRLTTGAGYDESGNQTVWGGWTYSYDPLDMMLTHYNSSKTYRFVYTADDERIAIYDAALNRWTWRIRGLDSKVLREYRNAAGTWSWQKDWIYRGGALLATDQPSIGIRHFALDHLGTPRLITSSTGATVATHSYYPFGEEATSETQDAEVMKFTGHERDTEFTNSKNSIDYMHARFYLPVLGRFSSVDPMQGRTKSPQSWNRYSYVLNSSLRFVDPNGMEPIDATVAAFLGDYFGSSVSHVQVFGGPFSRTISTIFRAEAVTFGQRVAFSRGGWTNYKAKTPDGIALAGHEVRHTMQYRQLGIAGFLRQYISQGIRAGGDPMKMPLEIVAYDDEKALLNLLEDTTLLKSIQNGTYSGTTGFKEQPLHADVYGGTSLIFNWEGQLFIDGVNYTGLFDDSVRRGRF